MICIKNCIQNKINSEKLKLRAFRQLFSNNNYTNSIYFAQCNIITIILYTYVSDLKLPCIKIAFATFTN